jgi:hypothetical protein
MDRTGNTDMTPQIRNIDARRDGRCYEAALQTRSRGNEYAKKKILGSHSLINAGCPLLKEKLNPCRNFIFKNNEKIYEGQSKRSRTSLTSTVWCTVSSYRLDRVLLAISPARQVAGRDSGFCTEPHIAQPPYSPGLAPSDFRPCPILKMNLKGIRFGSMENINSIARAELRKIPTESFPCYFQQWHDQWSKFFFVRTTQFVCKL